MSIESQELGAIYTNIHYEFQDDPEIQITPVSGDPPNQYEVTYLIPSAVRDEQGEISISSGHSVIISIPFGFPHFPPSCKPKSSIFHPDFDAAAICLSDFWNSERTIPELIHHIAKMIRGEIYSTENAFNNEAARWYLNNQNQLPFSSGPSDANEVNVQSTHELSLEKSEEANESDILENYDFEDDFNFEEFSDQEVPDADDPSTAPELQINRAQLQELVRQHRFKQLEEELSTTYRNLDFADKGDFSGKAAEALAKARTLYEEAENFENMGDSKQALQRYRSVQETVADFPHIKDDIRRAEQSSALLEDFAPVQHGPEESPPSIEQMSLPKDDTDHTRSESKKRDAKAKTSSRKGKKHFFEENSDRHYNIIPYVIASGIFCIIGAFTFFYFSLSSQLSEARQHYTDCTSNFAAKNFRAAEQACTTANKVAQSIFLIHQSEVSELKNNIRNILNSEEMRQGLMGNVLYQDKYVSKSTLAAHQSLEELLQEGEQFLKDAAWDEAAARFQKALELARRLTAVQPDTVIDIEQKFKYSAFRSMLAVAETHIGNQEWDSASKILRELQGQLSNLPPEHQAAYSNQISTLLAKSRFTNLKDQADKLFSKSDWQGAVALFQKAAEAGRALSDTSEYDELEDIELNIVRASLYATIKSGNRAFASGRWNKAIEDYQKAISTLNDNPGLIDKRSINQNIQKINRIILQSSIIRDRQQAEKFKNDGDNREALRYLDKVIETIRGSNFSKDPEFSEVLTETLRVRSSLQEEMFIDDKKQYLLNNYIDLFLANYPAATRDTLTMPVVTFEKKLDNLYLFKLQCTERGRGRPLMLVMYYAYNPQTDSWSFHSNK